MTTAGKLPAKFVIHTVGPVWNGGFQGEEEKLRSCYEKSLELAIENDCKTLAFPAISTGVYRFPIDTAARIAVKTVAEFLRNTEQPDKVIFVCFGHDNFNAIERELKNLD